MPDVSQVTQGTSGQFRSFDCFEPIRALEFCPLARNTEKALIAAGGDTRVAIGQFLTSDVSVPVLLILYPTRHDLLYPTHWRKIDRVVPSRVKILIGYLSKLISRTFECGTLQFQAITVTLPPRIILDLAGKR